MILKKFIAQGNVLDLAVGVIIGGAFGKIVNSLVNEMLMPIIGLLLNGINVASQFITLNGEKYATIEEAKKAGTGSNRLQPCKYDNLCLAVRLLLTRSLA